jgi:eukaryotic-like serine/threonine-protein kinase
MNIGDRIGDYEIVAVLGAGGMGQVYKVRNTLSQRVEAMKILLPNLEAEPSLADRFLREIKVQAALDHPNIAKLHTAMRLGNQLVMFMEFVDGTTLAKMIEHGPLSAGEASAYVAQVLDALGFAHAMGVVHRDIKPSNLMVTDAGIVKLMDFGIARVDDDAQISKVGTTVGSLAYMSPEQIRGGQVDARSDLYSLGITLYELVTGKRPFTGDSDYQIMSAHMQGIPAPPVSLVPGIPADLNEIILMAIAKDPQARFQSAAAFRAALVSVFPGIAPPLSASAAKPGTGPMPAPAVVSRDEAATVTATAMQIPHATPSPISAPKIAPRPVAPLPAAQPIAPSVPPYPQTVTPSGRRGLYMALGSIVTVAVLIAAVIEGPKMMHGGSSGAATTTQPKDLVSTPLPPEAAAPAPEAETAAPSSAPATTTSDNAAVAAKPSTTSNQAAPSTPSTTATSATQTSATSSKSRGGTAQPAVAQTTSQAAQTSQPPPPAPAQSAQEPEAWHRITGTPATPQTNPPARPAANPEAAELRNQFNELSIRANTARTGLQSFQQQQARQGLGLRADIREAETRLDFQLQESMTAIQAGNFDAARQSMRYAQNAVETIEKFLGR